MSFGYSYIISGCTEYDKEVQFVRSSIDVRIDYFPSPHLNQIYDGLSRLEESGLIKLKVDRTAEKDALKPILHAKINNHPVVFDELDGLNWIPGDLAENLQYFQKHFECEFYFKRSYCDEVSRHAPKGCAVRPLGLNISYVPQWSPSFGIKPRLLDHLRRMRAMLRYRNCRGIRLEDIQYYPTINEPCRVLFVARLWPVDSVDLIHIKEERKILNHNRVYLVRRLRKVLGDRFTGGLQDDSLARSLAPDLILSNNITSRAHWIGLIKEHDICIASSGLHSSIGWKFAEYVAAARAIITEPLKYSIPGQFCEGKNYLSFDNESDLVSKVFLLMEDREVRKKMMTENMSYFCTKMRSDLLMFNAIMCVLGESEC